MREDGHPGLRHGHAGRNLPAPGPCVVRELFERTYQRTRVQPRLTDLAEAILEGGNQEGRPLRECAVESRRDLGQLVNTEIVGMWFAHMADSARHQFRGSPLGAGSDESAPRLEPAPVPRPIQNGELGARLQQRRAP